MDVDGGEDAKLKSLEVIGVVGLQQGFPKQLARSSSGDYVNSPPHVASAYLEGYLGSLGHLANQRKDSSGAKGV